MSAAPRMFIVFNGAWLEAEASLAGRRGGLRILAREAETKWNLQPNLYEFRHTSGKVDSQASLQSALEAVRNGVCKLEIAESSEGRMMRTMHTEMKLLEDRVMAKVEAVLMDVRKETEWNNARLSGSIAPIVQCLATEQIEFRNKLGHLSTKVSDLTNQIGSVAAETSYTLKEAEVLEHELQQECSLQAACDLDLSITANLEELKEEVHHLNQMQNSQADRKMFTKINTQQGGYTMTTTVDSKPTFGFAYSSKVGKGLSGAAMFEARTRPDDMWSYAQLGDEVTVPFAQRVIAPQLYSSKSTFGHRSCPLLPPLH
jgi:hypothetical protein